VASLPEGMDKQNRNTHLVAVQPSVYLSWCPIKKGPIKVHHNPKNQAPLVTLLCDDLYTLYVQGVRVVDYSVPVGTPGRVFVCRCVLLFWYSHSLVTSNETSDVARMLPMANLVVQDWRLSRPGGDLWNGAPGLQGLSLV
jgi:hypothetical protein